ncbi:hypothetical protein [Shimia sp. Alg240-R146]|uniref:hypothetical protein n=1 Tax=Shimia sp. Alg240-R146 TaxID=2993449 RepID=UPI0022E8A093|nr:hypothetical protein [Shimia sp. Alg240-R146]
MSDAPKSWKIVDGKLPDDLRQDLHDRTDAHEKWRAGLPSTLEPPWKVFDYPVGSMGWRMGGGDDYMTLFVPWFKALPDHTTRDYINANPPPDDGWRHWIDNLIEPHTS